jgi:tryptophan-rich sensory protein
VFGPVWSVLYLSMAVAAWLVYRRLGPDGSRPLLTLYVVQLAANALWTWLFFAWRMGAVALAEVILLWLLVSFTTYSFWRARRAAGLLLLPYWMWVTFATALTAAVWRLNPGLL